MKLDNLTTEVEFISALKASVEYYRAVHLAKKQAVNEITFELSRLRKADRQADRWWHQYQNMKATMSDTVQAVTAASKFVQEIEQKHGFVAEGWYPDGSVSGRCLALTAPLCATCEAAELKEIDWKVGTNERQRFWVLLDNYTNDYRAGVIWITSIERQLDTLPESAFKDDVDLALGKLQWRLTQACTCSAMVASREFDNRRVRARIDDGRMAYLIKRAPNAAEAVIAPAELCVECRDKVIDTRVNTRDALQRVLERRANKQTVGVL